MTPSYAGDKVTILRLLNEALATELVCVLRYRRHYFCAEGAVAESVKKEFMEHAVEEQEHADEIAKRIVELGGAPDFSPKGLDTRSHSEYKAGNSLKDMAKEDLIAERIAIESYTEMIAYIGDKDPTTKRMLAAILAKEEEHAEDMSSIYKHL